MTDSQFDQIIREKMLSYECEVDDSLWDGIAARLARMDRRRVVLRYVYGAVAAAACVALGLFLFNGNDAPSQLQSAPAVTVAEAAVPEELETPADVQDIPSIADQIKALRSGAAVAEVLPSEVAKVVEAMTENASEPVPALEENAAPVAPQEPRESAKPASQPSRNTTAGRTPSGTGLMDDFYLFEDDEVSKPGTHASLTISSNVSGVASPEGFVYQMAPSHSASATGKSGGNVIEELSESSYSIPLSFGVQMRFPIAEKVSLGAGVNYTYLQREFSSMVNKVKYPTTISRLHYMGV
ncbi:MAG: hypothetical protein J6Y88_07925, partial [Bacteroidales bacterium]|nr:hypothetical protein [Bacteroidales bacterium]